MLRTKVRQSFAAASTPTQSETQLPALFSVETPESFRQTPSGIRQMGGWPDHRIGRPKPFPPQPMIFEGIATIRTKD